jgi:hypothetical protein
MTSTVKIALEMVCLIFAGIRKKVRDNDAGMSTAEYAVGTVAPVGRLILSRRPVIAGLHCVLLGSVSELLLDLSGELARAW